MGAFRTSGAVLISPDTIPATIRRLAGILVPAKRQDGVVRLERRDVSV